MLETPRPAGSQTPAEIGRRQILAGATFLLATACTSRPVPNPVRTRTYPVPSRTPTTTLAPSPGPVKRIGWQRGFSGGSSFPSTVTTVGDVLYASHGGELHALSAATGRLRWRSAYGIQVPDEAYAPVVGSGNVYTIVEPNSEHRGVLRAVDTRTGALRWEFSGGSPTSIHPPAASNALVYLQAAEGLYALDPVTGAKRWFVPTTLLPQLNFDGDALVLLGNLLYVVCTPAPNCVGTPSPTLVALDASTGELRWSRVVAALNRPGIPVSAAPGSRLILINDAGELSSVDAVSGAPRWRAATGDQSVPASAGTTVVVGTNNLATALDATTGRPRWQAKLTITQVNGVVADGNMVYLTGHGGIAALDLHSGRQRWHAAARQDVRHPAVDQKRVYAFAGDLLYAFTR
jgi:outer membrane protein assembly factor BamB